MDVELGDGGDEGDGEISLLSPVSGVSVEVEHKSNPFGSGGVGLRRSLQKG